MPEVELSPRGDQDTRDIWLYTAETWSEHQAQIYLDALFDEMEKLAKRPERGTLADDISPGLLKRPCESHMIFYRKTTQGVLIVRVLHQSMDFVAHLANDEA